MGSAIDMENDIQVLKLKMEKLENTVRGMVSKLDDLGEDMDEIYEKSSKTKHVDLVEDVKVEEDLGSVITGEYKNEKEKADNKGNGKGDKQSNNKSRKSSKKNI